MMETGIYYSRTTVYSIPGTVVDRPGGSPPVRSLSTYLRRPTDRHSTCDLRLHRLERTITCARVQSHTFLFSKTPLICPWYTIRTFAHHIGSFKNGLSISIHTPYRLARQQNIVRESCLFTGYQVRSTEYSFICGSHRCHPVACVHAFSIPLLVS